MTRVSTNRPGINIFKSIPIPAHSLSCLPRAYSPGRAQMKGRQLALYGPKWRQLRYHIKRWIKAGDCTYRWCKVWLSSWTCSHHLHQIPVVGAHFSVSSYFLKNERWNTTWRAKYLCGNKTYFIIDIFKSIVFPCPYINVIGCFWAVMKWEVTPRWVTLPVLSNTASGRVLFFQGEKVWSHMHN